MYVLYVCCQCIVVGQCLEWPSCTIVLVAAVLMGHLYTMSVIVLLY